MNARSRLFGLLAGIGSLTLVTGCNGGGDAPAPGSSSAVCTDDEWCWVRGRPLTLTGDRARNEVAAIGAQGSFFRWDGSRWQAFPLPTRRTVVSAWTAAASEACASDDAGNVFHFDGGAWSREPLDGRVDRVLGGDDGSCWAIAGGEPAPHGGASGARLFHRVDGAWIQAAPPHPYCMGGDYLVVDDVPWSAGLTCDAQGHVENVEVRRFDGQSWQLVGAPIEQQGWYPSLSRTAGKVTVRATGTFAWDGTTWSRAPMTDYPQNRAPDETPLGDDLGYVMTPSVLRCDAAYHLTLGDALCVGNGQVYRQGSPWSATIADPLGETGAAGPWGEVPAALWAGSDTRRAWGSGPSDVYRIRRTSPSALEHFDGARWETLSISGVVDVDGAAAGDVWIVDASGPRHLEDGVFVPRAIPADAAQPAKRIHALGSGRAAAISDRAVFVTDASGSFQRAYEAPSTFEIESIAGSSPDDLWITERSTGRSNDARLLRFTDGAWTVIPVEGLERSAELATRSGETWIATSAFVARLDGAAPVRFALDGWLADDRGLWIGETAVWLTTPTQARRHGLR